MTVAFALHAALGRAMKLAINLGSQFVQRLLVTRTPRLKQFGDFISSGSIQLKPLDLGGKESSFSLTPRLARLAVAFQSGSRGTFFHANYVCSARFSLIEGKGGKRLFR